MDIKILSYIKFYCIFLSVILIVIFSSFLLWYPSYYIDVLNFKKLIGLILLVNVGVGPLIALLIFNFRNISVRHGLAGIVLIQSAVLVISVAVIFYSRPVFTVFNVDRFTVVTANEIPPIEMNKVPQLSLPMTGPQFMAAKFPTNHKEREQILFSSLDSGVDLAQMPQYYLPYVQFSETVKSRIQPLEKLIPLQPEEEQSKVKLLLAASLAKRGLLQKDVGFLPLEASAQDMTVLVKRDDAVVIDILPIAPW
jgi:hypothetical protein